MKIIPHELTKLPEGKISNKLINRLTDIIHKNPDDKETEIALKVLLRLKEKDNRVLKRINKDSDGWYNALFVLPNTFVKVVVKTENEEIIEAFRVSTMLWWTENESNLSICNVKKWKPLQ